MKWASTNNLSPDLIMPLFGTKTNLGSSFLSAVNSYLVDWDHSQSISLSLTNLKNIIFFYPIRTLPKSIYPSDEFSITIWGIVILATNSKWNFGPFFNSIGTTVFVGPNPIFFFV